MGIYSISASAQFFLSIKKSLGVYRDQGWDFGNDIDSLHRAFSVDNQDYGTEANNAVATTNLTDSIAHVHDAGKI